jgi:ABC-type sugar transport system permease subunit
MNSQVGYASVIAFFLFLVVLVITLVQMRVTRFYED